METSFVDSEFTSKKLFGNPSLQLQEIAVINKKLNFSFSSNPSPSSTGEETPLVSPVNASPKSNQTSVTVIIPQDGISSPFAQLRLDDGSVHQITFSPTTFKNTDEEEEDLLPVPPSQLLEVENELDKNMETPTENQLMVTISNPVLPKRKATKLDYRSHMLLAKKKLNFQVEMNDSLTAITESIFQIMHKRFPQLSQIKTPTFEELVNGKCNTRTSSPCSLDIKFSPQSLATPTCEEIHNGSYIQVMSQQRRQVSSRVYHYFLPPKGNRMDEVKATLNYYSPAEESSKALSICESPDNCEYKIMFNLLNKYQ